MERYLKKYIQEDLDKKIILLTGPRQVGKTTLSKILKKNFDYFNFDNMDDRLSLHEKSWDRSKSLVVFDELHKLKNWKSWLKGIYDTEGLPPAILVTGSAKLDTYKKVETDIYRLKVKDMVTALTTEKIKKMPGRDLVTCIAILIDKIRLLEGESTQTITFQAYMDKYKTINEQKQAITERITELKRLTDVTTN